MVRTIVNGQEVENTNTKTRKITRGKTPEPLQEQEEVIENDEPTVLDWGGHPDYPVYIQFSPSTNKYRCIKHPEEGEFDRIGKHIGAKHEEDKDNHIQEQEEQEEQKDPKIVEIENLIAEKTGKNKESKVVDVLTSESIVLDNINKDIADGATKIAKNIHLQFLYIETKNIFPSEWTFEDWVSFMITFALERWGISYGVVQDMDKLTPEQLEDLKQARLSWKDKTVTTIE